MSHKGQRGVKHTVYDRTPSLFDGVHEVVIERAIDPDPVRGAAQLAAIRAEIEAGIFPAYTARPGMVYDFTGARIDEYRRIVGSVMVRLPDVKAGIGGRKKK